MKIICKNYTLHSGDQGLNLTPIQLPQLYKFPPSLNGAGQKVAFIELSGGFIQLHLNMFFAKYGIPNIPQVQFVSIDNAINHFSNVTSPDLQVMSDLAVAIGVAPGITPIVYMAQNTNQSFINALNQAINDKVDIINISWAMNENEWDTDSITQINNAFIKAQNANISVFCASGVNDRTELIPTVVFPASSPYVTSCGGELSSYDINAIKPDDWEDSLGGTGLGESSIFNKPNWQKSSDNLTKRGVPDVSCFPNPDAGIIIPCDGNEYIIAGAYCATPFWSGLTAVINQGLKKNVGFLSPLLYDISDKLWKKGVFILCPNGNNVLTNAVKGIWDNYTGLGSPNVSILYNTLQGANNI